MGEKEEKIGVVRTNEMRRMRVKGGKEEEERMDRRREM